MLSKTRKEALAKGEKFYFTGVACKRGHFSKRRTSDRHCIECVAHYKAENKNYTKQYNAERYVGNKENILKNNAEWRLKNPNKVKKINADYRKNNSDLIKESQSEHRKYNLASIKKSQGKYRLLNLDKFAEKRAKRRSRELERTPLWLSEDDKIALKLIYKIASRVSKETGIKHHVDHKIPLQGLLVSGLHTPDNLQLLTSNENLSKGNHFAVN